MVSCLMFKSLRHFEFTSVHGVMVCSNFIDVHAAVQHSQYHLKRLDVFSPSNFKGDVKHQGTDGLAMIL